MICSPWLVHQWCLRWISLCWKAPLALSHAARLVSSHLHPQCLPHLRSLEEAPSLRAPGGGICLSCIVGESAAAITAHDFAAEPRLLGNGGLSVAVVPVNCTVAAAAGCTRGPC
eukprot:3231741-Amphidinium_carterae.2